MQEWEIRGLGVVLETSPYDDRDVDLAVKARNLPIGLDAGGTGSPYGTIGGLGITIQEASNASHVEYWPMITMRDPDRRVLIRSATLDMLDRAENLRARTVAFFTMAFEVARVPSWEVAEEIVGAIYTHSGISGSIQTAILVPTSPIQASSFQYVLENMPLFFSQ